MAKLTETSLNVLSSLKEAGKQVNYKEAGFDGRAVGALSRKGLIEKNDSKGTVKITAEGRKALKEGSA